MKKFLYSIVFALMLVLTGCAKCISTETSTVQVKITDEYYKAAYTTTHYNLSTKTFFQQPHSAVYRITVEYDGVEYDIFDSDTYNKYSDKVGEYANGILRTDKYDDGSIRLKIINLE